MKQKPAVATVVPPEVRPGQSLELLKALHILTRDGKLNQDSRRKLKQVYHLFQFIEKLLLELPADQVITLADHGAGKSYLGFIIYDLFFKALGRGHIYGIETRAELVQNATALAAQLGFERMHFLNLSVADATLNTELPARFDMATACCQAEIAACLRQNKALDLARTPLAELWRHPLHTREIGSQLTNVLRCLYLEASGYQVTVTELVGWEHSLKNELILARRTGQRKLSSAQRLDALLEQFGLSALKETRFKPG
jgi:hypothetical protein